MKATAIFLAIITMSFSVIPCDDDLVPPGEDQQTSISQAVDLDMDICSPFCSCVCCASILINQSTQYRGLDYEEVPQEISTNYNMVIVDNYLSGIFQPPKN